MYVCMYVCHKNEQYTHTHTHTHTHTLTGHKHYRLTYQSKGWIRITDDDDVLLIKLDYYIFFFKFSLSIQKDVVYYVQYMCTSTQT